MGASYTVIHDTGKHVGVAFRRIADGFIFDFADGKYYPPGTAVKQRLHTVPERPAPELTIYSDRYQPTPVDQFTDGDHEIIAHDVDLFNANVPSAIQPAMYTTMHNGDDATVFPVTQMPAGTYQFTLGSVTGTLVVPAPTTVATK